MLECSYTADCNVLYCAALPVLLYCVLYCVLYGVVKTHLVLKANQKLLHYSSWYYKRTKTVPKLS